MNCTNSTTSLPTEKKSTSPTITPPTPPLNLANLNLSTSDNDTPPAIRKSNKQPSLTDLYSGQNRIDTLFSKTVDTPGTQTETSNLDYVLNLQFAELHDALNFSDGWADFKKNDHSRAIKHIQITYNIPEKEAASFINLAIFHDQDDLCIQYKTTMSLKPKAASYGTLKCSKDHFQFFKLVDKELLGSENFNNNLAIKSILKRYIKIAKDKKHPHQTDSKVFLNALLKPPLYHKQYELFLKKECKDLFKDKEQKKKM